VANHVSNISRVVLTIIFIYSTHFSPPKCNTPPSRFTQTVHQRSQSVPINCRLIRAITSWWPAKGPGTKQKSHKSKKIWCGLDGRGIPRQCNEKLITCGFLSCGHTHRQTESQTEIPGRTRNPAKDVDKKPGHAENFSFGLLPPASASASVHFPCFYCFCFTFHCQL